MAIEDKFWTPEKSGMNFKYSNKMAIVEPLKKIKRLDAGKIFDKADLLSKRLHNLTGNKAISYSSAGIIGVGKSTLPKMMRFYMEAKEYNEETNNLPLQLLYHDMFTYSFPFQFYVGERRWAQNHDAKRDLNSRIFDRSSYEDLLFTLNFVEMKAMSLGQYECVKDVLKKNIMDNGTPDVLMWLQAKPETAYKRMQSRGIEYEVKGKERPLTKKEKIEIRRIREHFIHLVGKYAPSELEDYKIKQRKAGMPEVMKAGGVTLDYLRSLDKRYSSDFKDVLKIMDFDGVLLKVNVDDVRGIDRRGDFNEQVAIMEHIKNASLFSLYRKGYAIEEKGEIIKLLSPFDNKKPYMK